MKRVLLICYYFPPLGGAGVARPLALVKHLPRFDYRCDVLTVKPVAYRLYEPELLDSIPEARIYRSGSSDPQRLMYMLGMRRVKARTIEKGRPIADSFFPDSKIGWVRAAVRYGRTLLNNRDYHAIISTSPPISSHLVARKLHKEFHRPWIADFRDYWTVYKPEDLFADRPLRRRKAKALLAAIKDEADAVTAVNDTVGEYVGAAQTIYNSFDEELAERWTEPSEKMFTIGVLGTINATTPIEPLLQAVARLRESEPELYESVRIRQVGRADRDALEARVKHHGLEGKVEMMGVRSRVETIRLLSEASLMYIGVATEKERGLSTGRIYTLLSSGRPILAWAPLGSEIRRLVEGSENGICCFGDVDEVLDYIVVQMSNAAVGEKLVIAKPAYAEQYSSMEMTRRFAELLDQQRPPLSRGTPPRLFQ